MASLPQALFKFSGDTETNPGRQTLESFLASRFQHLEPILAEPEWLAGSLSIADIAMANALRHDPQHVRVAVFGGTSSTRWRCSRRYGWLR